MELEPFIIEVSEREIRIEREKARALRKTQWWHTKISRGICHYCGRKFLPSELTMDHIVPVIRGGKSTRGNCVAACKDCNSRKKYMLPIEWQEYLERLQESAEGTQQNRELAETCGSEKQEGGQQGTL